MSQANRHSVYLVKVDGEWLVELDGEDEWALGELKNMYFE